MRRIAVTGSSGYLGTRLVRALLRHPEVESVIGLDILPPAALPGAGFRFEQTDVRSPFGEVFLREGVDAAVHLAYVFAPTRRRRRARAVNVDGTRHFLEGCKVASVGRAVVLGSATAYGAHADNPPRLTESCPLRAEPVFQYAYEKKLCDELSLRFADEHPEIKLAVCRPPIILGPNVDNYFSRMMFKPKIVYGRGHDPAHQFVHEDDIAGAIVALLEIDEPGAFNVAPPDTMTLTELAAEFVRAPMAIHPALLTMLCRLTYAARLSWLNETPPGALAYILHPWLIDGGKFHKATGFKLSHSTLETVRAWRESVLRRHAEGRPPRGKIRT
jgi:UDP-glucose 4-epimerase